MGKDIYIESVVVISLVGKRINPEGSKR